MWLRKVDLHKNTRERKRRFEMIPILVSRDNEIVPKPSRPRPWVLVLSEPSLSGLVV